MATAKSEKKENSIVTLKDVTFMYSSVSKPVKQLNTDNNPPKSDHELEFHSYEIKILITEDRFKELKRDYRGAKNLPNAKEHTPEEMEEKFGMEVEDDMVLVKFSQACLVGTGSKRRESFPIQQIGIKGKVQDINGNTIDQDTNLGNGSKGHFQFRPVEGKNGLYLYPQLLCITEWVEYVASGGEEDLDSLGLEDLEDTDMSAVAEETVAEQDSASSDDEEENLF
jgi:hypothetical protein